MIRDPPAICPLLYGPFTIATWQVILEPSFWHGKAIPNPEEPAIGDAWLVQRIGS